MNNSLERFAVPLGDAMAAFDLALFVAHQGWAMERTPLELASNFRKVAESADALADELVKVHRASKGASDAA